MLRAVTSRLRQLWQQCDLFDAPPPAIQPKPKRQSPSPHNTLSQKKRRQPRIPRTNPKDKPLVERLSAAYQQSNTDLFGGTLTPIYIRISRRMKNKLGHYMMATKTGLPAEIAISWQHIQRDSWEEVLHTLVHEMVHQWQDETGLPLDHGREFRKKAKEVGISGRATRRMA
ncbi:MAG TPA: SprT-like domain-containing protein [Gemmatimonadaceae bacterium]|jgi:hypothetical protein|nr:SprT-like domain-containing protein [Gemmatimonadaceae bacterium]